MAVQVVAWDHNAAGWGAVLANWQVVLHSRYSMNTPAQLQSHEISFRISSSEHLAQAAWGAMVAVDTPLLW